MAAYYNEFDKQKAAWLRELIKCGHIAPGDVDERSIKEVRSEDLRGYKQCHFFAGIGVWSYALRQAGWEDDRSVWTGSCPCQGFSVAGKRLGFADERHLWPDWFKLIAECRPDVVFGEEVAKKDGLAWLDLVQTDMEGSGYAIGAAVIPACGFGAPHLRERLYFVAERNAAISESAGLQVRDDKDPQRNGFRPNQDSGFSLVGKSDSAERTPREPEQVGDSAQPQCSPQPSLLSSVADTSSERRQQDAGSTPSHEVANGGERREQREPNSNNVSTSNGEDDSPTPANGFWADAEWIYCRDEKYRAVEPSTFPLAYGSPCRVGRLRGYGDAIVAEVAKGFVEAYMEVTT